MAAGRKPGPQCSYNDRVDIDDGTMCIAQSHTPGPLGITPNLLTHNQRGDCDAYAWAVQLAPAALYRATGYAFDGETLKGLLPDLVRTLKSLISTTANWAILGGFAGPLPVARIGKKDILTSLGVNFLPESIDSSLGEMICVLQMGISRMDNAGERRGADRDQEVEQAAEALAVASGVFVRLILQGIVAYLLNEAPMAREGIATGQAMRIPVSKIVPDAAVAQLVGKLRSSKLGNRFATWIEKNWKDLLKNPQLRVGPRRSGTAERVVSERRLRVPTVPSQPASDPPTFSDISFAAQAATLVAAAAQGAPFCPE